MIVSKQLERMNAVVVFRSDGFSVPDNAAFSALYPGPAGKGMRFVEDQITRTSVLSVPSLRLVFAVEGNRFRVDDDSGQDPGSSPLPDHFRQALEGLFPGARPESYGFNFDVYFRFGSVLPSGAVFRSFVSDEIFRERDLRDVGVQFTMERNGGAQRETYFIKFVDPLEIAVHANIHVPSEDIPSSDGLRARLAAAYNDIEGVVNTLKLNA
ncbi:MAG: hypothetical protein IT406_03445 [Candidatus Yanofskybacteria bacterium]|nr:hypothetical protein [Candidatus Yanofskybacteria bacterium]